MSWLDFIPIIVAFSIFLPLFYPTLIIFSTSGILIFQLRPLVWFSQPLPVFFTLPKTYVVLPLAWQFVHDPLTLSFIFQTFLIPVWRCGHVPLTLFFIFQVFLIPAWQCGHALLTLFFIIQVLLTPFALQFFHVPLIRFSSIFQAFILQLFIL